MLRQRCNGISTQCNDTARDIGIRDAIRSERGPLLGIGREVDFALNGGNRAVFCDGHIVACLDAANGARCRRWKDVVICPCRYACELCFLCSGIVIGRKALPVFLTNEKAVQLRCQCCHRSGEVRFSQDFVNSSHSYSPL